jgi:hypothetical protein
MTERIIMRRHTHFITGPKVDGGFLFRKYTPEEHEAFHFNNGVNAGAEYRLEFAPEQPGDVVLDLGCDELNEKLRGLLDEALQKWNVDQFKDFTFSILSCLSIEDEEKISKVPIGAV